MWGGREIVPCAAAVFAGNVIGDCLMPSPALCLLLSLLMASAALTFRKMFLMMAALAALGAASVQISRMPPQARPSALSVAAADAKQHCSEYLEEILPPCSEETGVFKAMAVGDKSALDRELKESYRSSGAMHLLALSGLHVGTIYGIVTLLMGFAGGSLFVRHARSVFTLVFLWMFAIMTGLSPSIFRAVLMITFYELSGLLGTDRDGPTALASSALIILFLQPEAPRDISFQLSYSALIGIFVIYPRLSPLLKIKEGPVIFSRAAGRLLKYIWEAVCLSISCQATCGMLAYLHFGTFPRYFMITNLIAIPLATLVMYAIVAAVAASFIPADIALPAELLRKALHLLNSAVRLIAEM